MHMIAHRSRDADAARRTFGLKPRRHIHRVAVQVSPIGNRVANVDPDAEADGPVGRLIAIVRSAPACCTFTAQRTAPSMLSNTMSRESPPVWTILPPCSSIAGSISVRAERPQPFKRSGIVQPDQAAVTHHVGIERRRSASADPAAFLMGSDALVPAMVDSPANCRRRSSLSGNAAAIGSLPSPSKSGERG